jgi:SAM-dependent methyltransferase
VSAGAPATGGWKRRVADGLDRARLLTPAVRAYEALLGLRGAVRSRHVGGTEAAGGLPVPPAQLRIRVGPSFGDPEVFLESGERHARLVRRLIEEQGVELEATAPVLDFGCGAGRVARHWNGVDLDLRGCDVNPKMVEWCRRNLPFGRFDVTGLAPPLPYADGSLGLVYAFSVFTHLPEELQLEWSAELRRVLRPGGYLLVSTLGRYYVDDLDRLSPAERERFDAGQVVVLYEQHAGENVCSAYHPREYVEETLSAGVDIVAYEPGSSSEHHDLHLLRKPASAAVGA